MRSLGRVVAVAALAMVAAAGVASAGPSGGGHGGGGGGHFAGGFHGGGFRGAPGGWRGGYGWRGGHGWRGYGYGCCGWGWGWGWGLGFYLPLLPWYYDTYWWNGVPYYYADGNYYLWNGGIGEYEAVEPPAELSQAPPQGSMQGSGVNPAVSSDLFAYPKGGQSEAQQKQDKEECRRWATSETGFNPAAPAPGKEPGDARQSYLRAEAACLEARNYAVR